MDIIYYWSLHMRYDTWFCYDDDGGDNVGNGDEESDSDDNDKIMTTTPMVGHGGWQRTEW